LKRISFGTSIWKQIDENLKPDSLSQQILYDRVKAIHNNINTTRMEGTAHLEDTYMIEGGKMKLGDLDTVLQPTEQKNETRQKTALFDTVFLMPDKNVVKSGDTVLKQKNMKPQKNSRRTAALVKTVPDSILISGIRSLTESHKQNDSYLFILLFSLNILKTALQFLKSDDQLGGVKRKKSFLSDSKINSFETFEPQSTEINSRTSTIVVDSVFNGDKRMISEFSNQCSWINKYIEDLEYVKNQQTLNEMIPVATNEIQNINSEIEKIVEIIKTFTPQTKSGGTRRKRRRTKPRRTRTRT